MTGVSAFGPLNGRELRVEGLELEEAGLWVVGERGLALLDLQTMKYDSAWASTKKITAFLNEDEFLWIARTSTPFNRSVSGSKSQDCRLLCYHKPTGKWCAEITVPYGKCAEQILRIDNTLWLGMSNRKNTLVSADLSGFSFAGN